MANSKVPFEGADLDWNAGKQFCVGCGGLRFPDYAERVPCFCCGSVGTQDKLPQFDENGELIKPTPKAEEPAGDPEYVALLFSEVF